MLYLGLIDQSRITLLFKDIKTMAYYKFILKSGNSRAFFISRHHLRSPSIGSKPPLLVRKAPDTYCIQDGGSLGRRGLSSEISVWECR